MSIPPFLADIHPPSPWSPASGLSCSPSQRLRLEPINPCPPSSPPQQTSSLPGSSTSTTPANPLHPISQRNYWSSSGGKTSRSRISTCPSPLPRLCLRGGTGESGARNLAARPLVEFSQRALVLCRLPLSKRLGPSLPPLARPSPKATVSLSFRRLPVAETASIDGPFSPPPSRLFLPGTTKPSMITTRLRKS